MTTEFRLNRSLRYDTFPHHCVLNGLEFEIVEFALDEDRPVTPEDTSALELAEYDEWETASLTLAVEIPADVLEKVFPGTPPHPGTVVVAGHCVDTYMRGGTILNDSREVTSGRVSDKFEITADNVAGTVEFHPYLVRSIPLDEGELPSDHDFATDPGEMVADGRDCTVRVDEETAGSDDVLSVDRTSFAEENEAGDSPFPPEDRLYYLDLKRDPDNPVLFFNEDHERIVDIVWNDEDAYEELTQDLVWDHVMSAVWTRMIQIAAADYDPHSDPWTPEWQPAVFDVAAEHLYPDEEPSPEKAAEFLRDDLSENVLSATERIERAVQGILDPAVQFDNHIARFGES